LINLISSPISSLIAGGAIEDALGRVLISIHFSHIRPSAGAAGEKLKLLLIGRTIVLAALCAVLQAVRFAVAQVFHAMPLAIPQAFLFTVEFIVSAHGKEASLHDLELSDVLFENLFPGPSLRRPIGEGILLKGAGRQLSPSLKVCHGGEVDSQGVVEEANLSERLQIQVPFAVFCCFLIIFLNYAVLIPGIVAERPVIGIERGRIVLQLRGFG
jgi:hypothetical protein